MHTNLTEHVLLVLSVSSGAKSHKRIVFNIITGTGAL